MRDRHARTSRAAPRIERDDPATGRAPARWPLHRIAALLALILLLTAAAARAAVAVMGSGSPAAKSRVPARLLHPDRVLPFGPDGRIRRSAQDGRLVAAAARARGTGADQSVAFWLAWSGQIKESQIPWSAVTQVDLFSLTTNTKTSGCASDCTSLDPVPTGISRMNVPRWVSTIHQHGKLALISIGGSSDRDWVNACRSKNLPGFTSKLINYMISNGFDGVDVDIEAFSGAGKQMTLWTACERSIAKAAHSTTTHAGRTPIVSTDVDQSWMDSAVAQFERWPDQFNLMYYGYPTGSYSCANGCAQVKALVDGLHRTGHVPFDRMMLGMSPGGNQDQCCYQTLDTTRGRVDTSATVRSIRLASKLVAALPAGQVVLAARHHLSGHYEVFTTSGAGEGATSIPITGKVFGSGGAGFRSGSLIQSDYAGPWDCGNFAGYAAATGLEGVMIWDLQEEALEHHGRFPCFAQVAPYVGAAPSNSRPQVPAIAQRAAGRGPAVG